MVSVTVYDIARQPALARFFKSPEAARLARYAIVLSNESTGHIVGVAMRWILIDHNGQSRTTIQSFDSFGTSLAARQPVIPTGTQLPHGTVFNSLEFYLEVVSYSVWAAQEVSQALVSVVDSLSLRWTRFRPFLLRLLRSEFPQT
jgi:hypothetical protein